MDSASVKKSAAWLINALGQRSYFAVFIDRFFSTPLIFQKAFVEYVVSEVEIDEFKKYADDSTLWLEFINCLLYYYSGRQELDQPSTEDLARLISDFYKSGKIDDTIENSDDFIQELKEL